MAEKYPWAKMRHEYITGDCSYGALAEKYGVARLRTLTDRASAEGWVAARKTYRATVAKRAAGKAATKASKALARHKDAADKAMDKLNLILDQTDPDKPNEPFLLGAKELRDVVLSLRELVAIQRDLYNLPTQQEAFAQLMAMEKLSLDAQRNADPAGEESDETGVVMLSEVLDG